MSGLNRNRKHTSPLRRACVALLVVGGLVLFSGCHGVRFYGQAVRGQCQLILQARSVDRLLASPRTSALLKERLKLFQDMRSYAQSELKLPVDDQYKKYVDLHRPYVVWNVEAAPEFSMEPKGWRYPLVGRLDYRGYFTESGARDYAARLRHRGYDVHLGGVRAYSTLGWFKDPVLSSFLFEPEAELAETLFHELSHQRVFARGDTDFSEAFATTVGQEATRRWLLSRGDAAASRDYNLQLQRNTQFVSLILKTRLRLENLYGDKRTEDGVTRTQKAPQGVQREHLRLEKQRILTQLDQEYVQLKAEWGGRSDYDAWFAKGVNNAKLNSVAAYFDLVPAFERLLAANAGDLEKFYEAVKRLSRMPKKQRHQWLRSQGHTPNPAPSAAADSSWNRT